MTPVAAPSESDDFTDLLKGISEGDSKARDELFRRVYFELRQRAEKAMIGQPNDHSLWATGLVHQAYLKLCKRADVQWVSRRHFLAVASIAMKNILVDHARARGRKKRRAEGDRVPLDALLDAYQKNLSSHEIDILDLNDKLEQLKVIDARRAEVVNLRYFAGLSFDEVADVMRLPKRTVEREWTLARIWLFEQLG